MKITRFLIARSDGNLRIVTKRPRLGADEVAFRIEVTIPDTWGKVHPDVLALSMPDPPDALVQASAERAD